MTSQPFPGKTVVLVTNQFCCERLIHSGKTLADATNTELCVYSVQSNRYPQNPLALEHLYHISKQYDAEMHVDYSDEPVRQIIRFIKSNKARNVLTGNPENEESILYTVWRKFTHINFFTVDAQGVTTAVSRADLPARKPAAAL